MRLESRGCPVPTAPVVLTISIPVKFSKQICKRSGNAGSSGTVGHPIFLVHRRRQDYALLMTTLRRLVSAMSRFILWAAQYGCTAPLILRARSRITSHFGIPSSRLMSLCVAFTLLILTACTPAPAPTPEPVDTTAADIAAHLHGRLTTRPARATTLRFL